MAPSELLSPNGAIDYWYRNDRPGIEWLIDIRKRFRKVIWLNPEPSSGGIGSFHTNDPEGISYVRAHAGGHALWSTRVDKAVDSRQSLVGSR